MESFMLQPDFDGPSADELKVKARDVFDRRLLGARQTLKDVMPRDIFFGSDFVFDLTDDTLFAGLIPSADMVAARKRKLARGLFLPNLLRTTGELNNPKGGGITLLNAGLENYSTAPWQEWLGMRIPLGISLILQHQIVEVTDSPPRFERYKIAFGMGLAFGGPITRFNCIEKLEDRLTAHVAYMRNRAEARRNAQPAT